MNTRKYVLPNNVWAALAAALCACPAHAAVTISAETTQNISCSAGVCEPTASDAVLNVNDLENYLAAGNIEVTTTGSGVEAADIDVEAALSWSNPSALSLIANQAIKIDQLVSVKGGGGLLIANDGVNEDFSFGSSGHVTFSSLSSSLTINGQAYTLEKSIKSLAKAIANNPSGNFALAKRVNAKKDGTYKEPPVSTTLDGSLEGLGNSIENLKVKSQGAGMFLYLQPGSVVRNVGLQNVNIDGFKEAGSLAVSSYAYVSHCFASGLIIGGHSAMFAVGGLLAENGGTVSEFSSSANVTGNPDAIAGGLVGKNGDGATIESSFSTGSVTATMSGKKSGGNVGGLVGENFGAVSNTYSTGSATGTYNYNVGGLIGSTQSVATSSYSTGLVSDSFPRDLGGLVGYDSTSGQNDDYWDTDTSGVTTLSQGAGYPSNDPGITGLTTAQLQSGLPTGFDPSVWAESASINNGLPYLIANPPTN